MHFENPFTNYGEIVRGERFIGRHKILNVIENRVIYPANPGNLAIIGVHRIGKSSLAYKRIIEQTDKLIDKGILPIWINLSSYDQSLEFFSSLVDECVNEMEDLDWLTEKIQRFADRALETDATWDRTKRFFKEVQKAGYGVLFILDEFDHARNLFKGETAFQRLRELADYPDYRLSLVLTSRRNIRDIERLAGSTSPFHNIFQVQRLAMFNDEDLEIYFSRFSDIGMSISDEHKKRVLFYCGSHPYLLEMLGWEIVERFRQNREQEIDVDKAANTILQSIFEHYDDMIGLLRDDETINKFLQILFGPVIDVKPTDVTELQNYGLIKPTENGIYAAYSEHFQGYLEMQERAAEFAADLWPLWSKTEKAFREVIATTLSKSDEYGGNWIENLEAHFSHLHNIFNVCRELQEKEKKFSADSASLDLINFTNPSDLFQIVFANNLWNSYFQQIFGQTKKYWEKRNQFLTRCRNALAHNRENILTPDQVHILEKYCGEILNVYENWLNTC